MTYLVLSATYFIAYGWRPFIISLDLVHSDVSIHEDGLDHKGKLMYIYIQKVALLFPSTAHGIFNDPCHMYGYRYR